MKLLDYLRFVNFAENIRIAISSIKDNFLRSLLTLLIIAVGITSMVGILTAIDSVLFSMSDNFNRLGANSFSFRRTSETIKTNTGGRRRKRGESIKFDQAIDFKEAFRLSGSKVSIDVWGSRGATIKYKNKKSTPTVSVVGIDENFLFTSAYDIEYGRNFTASEVFSGGNKVVIGSDIVKVLFDGKPEKVVGKVISVNTRKYKVIGVLKQKGNSAGDSSDKRIFMTLFEAKKLFGSASTNYNVTVSVSDPTQMEEVISNSIGAMRNIRRLKVTEPNDFEIRKSDGILEQLKDMTLQLRVGTMIIVGLTLLGAAIGLMNIMLVTVTERTKEIGVRKALGATRNNVLLQFLTEAVMICFMGGIVGIIFGTGIGFLLAKFALKSTFVIPWFWMMLGMLVCIVVGVASGIYPALKASRMDPIESLRYE